MSLVHCIHDFLNHKTEMDNIERRGEESYSIEFLVSGSAHSAGSDWFLRTWDLYNNYVI